MTEPRKRQPEATRRGLLEAAFEEIYVNGFQAASLHSILRAAEVTKGALYHHFASKAELGIAVLDEVIRGVMLEDWIQPVAGAEEDPIGALQRVVRAKADKLSDEEIALGCPLNNLAQEMSPVDERFRERVNETFEEWETAFAEALERGQAEGSVRRDVDTHRVAAFLVSSIEGTFGRAKNAESRALLESNFELLRAFLETLRPEAKPHGDPPQEPRSEEDQNEIG